MKTNWQTKKLGDVIELYYGKGLHRSHRKSDGHFPILGANGELGRTDSFLVEGEAIIVGRKGSAGEVARISGKFWPSDVTYYVFGNDNMNINYLYYFFKSVDLTQFARGVKPGINRNDVYDLETPLPPLEEQKRIVGILDEKMEKIREAKRLREQALVDADKILPQTLREIFEDGKQEFRMISLGDVAKLVRGPFGGSLKKEIFVSSGDCVYEQGNVIDNKLEDFRYFITPEKFNEMKRFAVSAGDILMSCSGTIGKFIIIPKQYKKGIINQALLKISPKETVLVEYLKYALQDYLSISTTHIKGGAIKNIASVKDLKQFSIPFPSIVEQRQIVARLDNLSEKVRHLRELQLSQLADLKKLEQAYLREAFMGEL